MSEPSASASRRVRRLARLFRIERQGGFAGRPQAVIARLLGRRGALVTELLRLGTPAEPFPAELHRALAALREEAGQSLGAAALRLEHLEQDLRAARGQGSASGLRGSAGRVIASG